MRRNAEIVMLIVCSSIFVWMILSFLDIIVHNKTDQKYAIWNCFNIFFKEDCSENEIVSSYYKFDIPKKTIKPITEQTVEPTKKPVKKKKTEKKKVNEADVLNLARIIHAENGGHKDDEALLLTGVVVLKRVKSKHYPDTIIDVISQKGQYSTYADGKFWNEPSKRSVRIARKLLSTNISEKYPNNLVFQSEFKQGKKVYKKLGHEYFCLA